jgi:hypothetical protein
MHSTGTGKWRAYVTPENATYDSRGYVVNDHVADNSSWSGRLLSTVSRANAKCADKQHALGYKYYDTEPGEDPVYMGQYDQNTITGVFWDNVCTIL